MGKDGVFEPWLKERNIEDIEALVPDMAGSARGKIIPAEKFGSGQIKMPESIFSQTISGDYIDDENNVEDRDMLLVPDPTTLRPVPWLSDPAASVFFDCYHRDGATVTKSPRAVLRNVLAKFEALGCAGGGVLFVESSFRSGRSSETPGRPARSDRLRSATLQH